MTIYPNTSFKALYEIIAGSAESTRYENTPKTYLVGRFQARTNGKIEVHPQKQPYMRMDWENLQVCPQKPAYMRMDG